jgi:probable O-glycosylation ligase (exosortase A-associated)
MRDFALVFAVIVGLGLTLRFPFVGLLLWTWFSFMSPQSETFWFAREAPLNMIVAAVTVLVWLLSSERKMPPNHAIVWLSGIFLVWVTFNGFFAVDPDWSWQFWDRAWKTFALGLVMVAMVDSRVRLHALSWVIVISLFYYGVKGGLFTLATGGAHRVLGPSGTIIGDNNQLALALLMVLPLANYLRSQSKHWWVSLALLGGMGLTVIAIIGSDSRGGFIGLAILTVAALLKVRKKMAYAAIAALVIVPTLYYMPETFFARVNSIAAYDTDGSFLGRLRAWEVAFSYARDHFPLGAGFYGPQLGEVFNAYFPQYYPLAAHSIYFQVLGEQGFVGLALYLMMLVAIFVQSAKVRRATARRPELAWAHELGTMIQLSMIVFCVCGAALSMAYYDGLIACSAMLVSLSRIAIAANARKDAFSRAAVPLREARAPAVPVASALGGAHSGPG